MAKRAELTSSSPLARSRHSSMARLVAPIALAGLAALSEETAKYLPAPPASASARVLAVFTTLVRTMRIRVKGSFSLRTCFSAVRLRTWS